MKTVNAKPSENANPGPAWMRPMEFASMNRNGSVASADNAGTGNVRRRSACRGTRRSAQKRTEDGADLERDRERDQVRQQRDQEEQEEEVELEQRKPRQLPDTSR
jgi:hypothetical protein